MSDYADDGFEDYEDDFEALDEQFGGSHAAGAEEEFFDSPTLPARASGAGKVPGGSGASRTSAPITSVPSHSTTQRRKDLMKLVGLAPVSFMLLEMCASTYSAASASMSRSADVQMPPRDQWISEGTDTEPVEVAEKGLTAPDDLFLGSVPLLSPESAIRAQQPLDSVRLARFLRNVGPVIDFFCENNVSREFQTVVSRRRRGGHSSKSSLQSEQLVGRMETVTLEDTALLSGRAVRSLICPSRDEVVVVYGPSAGMSGGTAAGAPPRHRGIVCWWNRYAPSRPSLVFVSAGSLTSCCCTSTSASATLYGGFLICGTEEGTLHVWDMNEPEYHHTVLDMGTVPGPASENAELRATSAPDGTRRRFVLRNPSFVSDYESAENHSTPVVSVYSKENGPGTSPTVVSLDETGTVVLWSLLLVSSQQASLDADSLSHPSDMGASSHSRVRLLPTQRVVLLPGILDPQPMSAAEERIVASAFYPSPMFPGCYTAPTASSSSSVPDAGIRAYGKRTGTAEAQAQQLHDHSQQLQLQQWVILCGSSCGQIYRRSLAGRRLVPDSYGLLMPSGDHSLAGRVPLSHIAVCPTQNDGRQSCLLSCSGANGRISVFEEPVVEQYACYDSPDRLGTGPVFADWVSDRFLLAATQTTCLLLMDVETDLMTEIVPPVRSSAKTTCFLVSTCRVDRSSMKITDLVSSVGLSDGAVVFVSLRHA